MITLRQIDAFRAVMVTGTVTGASKMLNISQPAVSRLLQDLERIIGFELFVRGNRQLVPTAEGRYFYEEVETAFTGLDQIYNAAVNIRTYHSGHLRLVTIPSVVAMFIADIVAAFSHRYPNVSISMEVQPTQRVFEYITSGQCDIGLSTLPIENPAVISQPVLHGRSVCIVPESHRLARKKKIVPRDLVEEEFISYRVDSNYRHKVDDVFAAAGVDRRLRIESRTTESICNLVSAGLGVSIIGPAFPGMRLQSGVVALPFEPAIHGDLALLYLRQRKLPRIPESFAQVVKSYVSENFRAPKRKSRARS